MITFTKSFEKANPTRPEGTPLLHLGYKNHKGEDISISFGVNKLRDIVENFETFKADINKASLDEGYYMKEYTFGTKYPWTITMTVKKFTIIEHYLDDIKAYIDKYYVPWTPKDVSQIPKKCIENPCTSIYEDDKCNIKYKLLVPCWDKKEIDEGEGKRPWNVTEWLASFLVRDGESGKCYDNIKKWLAQEHSSEDKYEPITEYEVKLSKEQCEAFVKYYDTFLKFVLNPTSI